MKQHDRHQMLMIVVGETGVGKTYRTIHEIKQYVKSIPHIGKKGRKVLIFDVNDDDYQIFFSIDPNRIKDFKKIMARRIRPLTPSGKMMTIAQKRDMVGKMVNDFKGGMLVFEDLDKFMVGAKGQDIVGLLCANRHSDLDVLIAHQSIAKITTTEWQAATWLRIHKQVDDIYRYRDRITNYPLVRIASFIVEEQYNLANDAYESGRISKDDFIKRRSFFVYVDLRRSKILGCSKKSFLRAAKRYVDQEESKKIRMLRKETDNKGNLKYPTQKDALLFRLMELLRHFEDNHKNVRKRAA